MAIILAWHSALGHFVLSLPAHLFHRWTTLAQPAFARDTFTDLFRTKTELIAENALLRQQLAILHRQVKRPQLNRRDRFWLLASPAASPSGAKPS